MIDRSQLNRVATAPALFIAGAPRCGTTSLARALAQQRHVAFSNPKEPHFFTALSDPVEPAQARQRYLERHFAHLSGEHRVLAEGTVSILYQPAAVKRILQCFPNARFIAMVRNPIDLLASYHGRMLFLLDEDQPDFRTAWELQSARAAGRHLPRECRDPNLLRYADVGRIGAAVKNLFAAAGRQRCHVVVYDDFVRDSHKVAAEILGLVGLQPDGVVPIKRRNVHRTYRYRWLQRVFRRPNQSVANLMLRAEDSKAGGPAPIARMVEKIKRWNVLPVRREPLDAEFRAELAATYREDIEMLSELIGRDLTPWLAGRAVAPQTVASAAENWPA